MACKYCGKDVDGKRPAHPECDAEWGRRYDAGTCTRCGERDSEPYGPACGKCIDGRRPMPYRNYPGGMT